MPETTGSAPADPHDLRSWGRAGYASPAFGDSAGLSPERREQLQQLARTIQARTAEAAVIMSAGDIVRQQAAREERDEQRRLAAGDPREILRAAHEQRTEAAAEVGAAEELARRTRDVVARLEQRHGAAVASARQAEKTAAGQLLASLRGNDAGEPAAIGADVLRESERLNRGLVVAKAALVEAEAASGKAKARLADCERAVARGAIACLISEGLEIATTIDEADHTAAAGRRALAALGFELTERDRRLNAGTHSTVGLLPSKFSRILLGPRDEQLTTIIPPAAAYGWAARFAALVAGERSG
jgi:hypothetical protein